MLISDWSSDVCSSDLLLGNEDRVRHLDARLASAGRASFFTSMKFARFRRVPFGPIVDFVDAWRNSLRKKRALVPSLRHGLVRSEEHTSELQSLMRISYAVFCLKKKIKIYNLYNFCIPIFYY